MLSLFVCLFWLICFLYAAVVASLYLFQEKIIFRPAKNLALPAYYCLPHMQVLILQTSDHIAVTAWYHPPANVTQPVLLYFHGNTGHIGDRALKLKHFTEKMGVLALSYRGYGSSEGNPSEKGFYLDARAALNFLHSQDIASSRIILYGESLGTGVAVDVATEHHVAGVVLEAPYTSITARGRERYPYIPVHILIKHRFDSLSKIAQIASHLLILHGEQDLTVPVQEGKKLLAMATSPKESVFFPDIGHTDFDATTLAELTYAFAQKVTTAACTE